MLRITTCPFLKKRRASATLKMNNSSPFKPQSSDSEPKNVGRQRVRFAVFCILSMHIAGLVALLLTNGCRRTPEPDPIPAPEMTNTFDDQPVLDPPTNYAPPDLPTNDPAGMPPHVETNTTYVPPTNQYTEPAPVIQDPVPQYSATQEYTVVKGDTFSSIARKFPGVSIRALQEANPSVQPTRLRIGMKLQIPAAAAPSPSASARAFSNGNGERSYTVKSGDTLTSIASRNGTTVRALRNANNLNTDRIRVGQKLTLPAKAPAPAPLPAGETAPGAPSLTPPGQF